MVVLCACLLVSHTIYDYGKLHSLKTNVGYYQELAREQPNKP